MEPSQTIRTRAFARPDPALLAELADATTPDLANALGAAVVADPALRPVWRHVRALGAALTVQLAEPDNLAAIHAALDAQPGDVLVVETPPGSTVAIAGALLGRAAKIHGIAGLVIDGAVRDTDALEAMRLPVWSRCVCARQATKSRGGHVGYPVTCGGVRVEAGDVVLADDDGIVFASPARVREGLDALRRGIANEQELQDDAALVRTLRALVGRVTIDRG